MGGSSTVTGAAVRRDLGRRKLEEKGRKKLLFEWRLQRMNEGRLVRNVVALLDDCRGWWAEYCELKEVWNRRRVRSSRLACNMEELREGCS